MKPLPTLSGTQYPGDMPWGMKVATNRGFGVAAVCASSVAAGTIASSSGRASVTPVPRRKVRRGMCFFAINMGPSLSMLNERRFAAPTSAPLMLFWNGALLTTPSTSVEKR